MRDTVAIGHGAIVVSPYFEVARELGHHFGELLGKIGWEASVGEELKGKLRVELVEEFDVVEEYTSEWLA